MNKKPDNNDFQDLFQIYAESRVCKNEDEEDKDEEKLANEETDEVEETDDDVQEEGLFDRLKAKGSSIKAGAEAMGSNVKGAARGVGSQVKHNLMGGEKPAPSKGVKAKDVSKIAQAKKTHSILNSHIVKLDNALSNLATDVTKLGVMDASEAEELAQQISTQINKSFVKKTKGRALTSKGRRNF